MGFTVGAKDPREGSIWSTYTASSSSGTSDGGGEGSGYTGDGTRRIYVSNSGSDSNPGTELLPKLTLMGASGAISLRTGRSGKPDWLLLKRGDTWDETTLLGWKSGRSADEPTIITCYGDESDPMPVWKCNFSNGGIYDNSNIANIQDYMAIMHIDFYCSERDPNNSDYDADHTTARGANSGCQVNWRLIEGCHFRFCNYTHIGGSTPYVPLGTLYIRNTVFADVYGTQFHAMFLFNIATPILHNVYCDRNVWYQEVGTYATIDFVAPNNGMTHTLYLQTNCGPGEYHNVFMSRSSDLQMRTGGTIRNVLCNHTTNGFLPIEGTTSPTSTTTLTGLRTGLDVEDCVILRASDCDGQTGAQTNASGITAYSADGGWINNCIFAHSDSSVASRPDAGSFTTPASAPQFPSTNCTGSGNIVYNIQSGIGFFAHASTVNCEFDETNMTDINGDNTEYEFLDPDNASLGKYLELVLGVVGATDDDFYALIRLQRKGNWNDALGMYAVIPWMKHRFAVGDWFRATVED